jgi:hypothetical protein
MDPYDEILEQLRSAREQGLRTVMDRLDGILGSLEAATGSVRDAMALDVEDLAPLGGIPEAVDELKQAAAEAAEVPPPVVSIELLRNLDAANTQSELLHGLLSALTAHTARAVVLVFRKDAIGAWSAIGFEDASRLERWSCDRGESPMLDDFVDRPAPRRLHPLDDPVLRGWLEGEAMPDEALLLPISLRGKTMGAMYVDRLGDRPWNPEAAQILVALSCWMIDTLKYRTETGSPMLTPIDSHESGLEAEVEPAETSETIEEPVDAEVTAEPEPEPEPEPGELAEDVAEQPAEEPPQEPAQEVEVEPDVEVAAEGAGEVEVHVDAPAETAPESEHDQPTAGEAALDEIASGPDFDPSATVQVEPEDAPPEVEAADEDEPSEEASVEVRELDETPAAGEPAVELETPAAESEVPMPPPVEPVVPPPDLAEEPAEPSVAGLSAEEESRHEEARRFARLLVSEIKLYNEEAVERGREQRDLYARLKEDIDRSREMFERRIPPEIRATRDYFQEELVRILGDGDAEALGM